MSIWSKAMPTRLITAAVSLACLGCQPPKADNFGIELKSVVVPERFSSVTLCLANPNSDALVFRRVTVILDHAGSPLATGSLEAAIIVPAFSSTRIPVAVLAIESSKVAQTSDVDYRIDGSVALDRAFGLNIPYRHSGHLDVGPSSADDVLYDCLRSDVAVPL